jgi:hypothetical protein
MATITISDLRPAGYDLLSDSESFLSNLSEEELSIQGGNPSIRPFPLSPICLFDLLRNLY